MFNKPDNIKIKLEGREYQWDWEKWIDLKSFIQIPILIASKLNLKLKESIITGEIDLSNLEIKDLTTIASNFKEAGAPEDSPSFKDIAALEIAVFIIDKLILTKDSRDSCALTVLCSVLRKLDKPEEALERTKDYAYPFPALFTTRAAAMCDLELWAEAKHEVGIALAIEKNPLEKNEAFNVVK